MATRGDEQNKEERKGFAGLSALVSDVDTSPPPPAKQEAATSDAVSNAERRAASESQQPQPRPKQEPSQAPSHPPSSSSTGKWVLLGIAAVMGALWLIGEADKSPTSPAPSYSPPARSTTPSYSAAPAQPQVPARPDETKPPVGQDLVFSMPQIRYCLAEDIRMDAAKVALDNYSDSDVNRFNAMVADYNSRCGSFRYRSGSLESARRDVERYRSQLQAEGRSRFARTAATGSVSASATPTQPVADETVKTVQQKLNELGYNAGPADGLTGARTRAAIVAFQEDRGLAATGIVNQALVGQLQQAPPRSRETGPASSASVKSQGSAGQQQRSTSAGMPDLSSASQTEQASIERACRSAREDYGPGNYHACLSRELQKLSASFGRPDLSRLSQSQQASIERACRIAREYFGPGDYYNCLRREAIKFW